MPSFFPQIHERFSDYLAFDLNWSALWAIVNWLYYFALEPFAAVRLFCNVSHTVLLAECIRLHQLVYFPQQAAIILTAASFSHKADAIQTALYIHVGSWIAQFAGHFLAEGRSPALLDNLLGGECPLLYASSHGG